jgi:hypothetical protein
MVFLPVPWYSIYPASVDPDWLAGVVLRHAAFVATAAAAARSIQALLRRREVAQFKSACLVFSGDEAASNGGNDRDDDDDDCGDVADASLPPPDDFATHLSACVDKSYLFVASIRDRAASVIAIFLAMVLSMPARVAPAASPIDDRGPRWSLAPTTCSHHPTNDH